MPHLNRLRGLELKLLRYLALVDLEATCCDRGTINSEEMEIIEVGVVVIDLQDGCKVVDEFSSFVRPVRNPVLTPFCTRLTTISQADIESARSWRDVSAEVAAFVGRFPELTWASWGNYDRNQISKDSQDQGVQECLPAGLHTNFKAYFSAIHNLGKQLGMKAAVNRCGLVWSGTHHRAISDARNLAAVAPYVLCRKNLPATFGSELQVES